MNSNHSLLNLTILFLFYVDFNKQFPIFFLQKRDIKRINFLIKIQTFLDNNIWTVGCILYECKTLFFPN